MKTLRYIALAALTLSFAACEQEDINPAVQGDPDAVKINATISNMQTRVAYSGDNGVTNFVNGDAVKVVNLMRTSKNEATYTTTDGTNWTTTDAMVWNSSSKNKFQAWYPVAEYSSYDMFMIPTDQSDATKLVSADWMTASTGEIDKPGNGVLDLNFQHRLAKVTVNLTFSSQYPEGYQHVSDFTFYTNEETQQAITPLANSETSYTAILRPGEYADESYFIFLVMDDIDEHWVLGKTTTSAIDLEPGKHYTFTLKVGKDVVSIDEVTVADWDEVDIDGGVAEEVIVPIVEDFTPVVTPAAGEVTIDQMCETTITFDSPIASFDDSGVYYIKPNSGKVWLKYNGTYTISEDKLTLILTWDLVESNYPVGSSSTLVLPAGCIVLENGAKNLATEVPYTLYEKNSD